MTDSVLPTSSLSAAEGLPSRPSIWESVLTASAVVALAGWAIVLVSDLVEAQSEREAGAAALLAGDDSALDAGERYLLRNQLVDVNLGVLRDFHPASASVDRYEPLAASVESLLGTPANTEVRAALGDLLQRLDRHEQEVGYLDSELEATRALLRDALPSKED